MVAWRCIGLHNWILLDLREVMRIDRCRMQHGPMPVRVRSVQSSLRRVRVCQKWIVRRESMHRTIIRSKSRRSMMKVTVSWFRDSNRVVCYLPLWLVLSKETFSSPFERCIARNSLDNFPFTTSEFGVKERALVFAATNAFEAVQIQLALNRWDLVVYNFIKGGSGLVMHHCSTGADVRLKYFGMISLSKRPWSTMRKAAPLGCQRIMSELSFSRIW